MRRYLVVANQTLAGEPLVSRIREHSRAGPASFFLLVPATPPRNHVWTEGEARSAAAARLQDARHHLAALGIRAEGEVGDGNPMLAIGDAIRDRGPFDEIILSTLPPGASRWLKLDLPHRVAAGFGIPMTHVVGEPADVGASRR
jgi:GABA permease